MNTTGATINTSKFVELLSFDRQHLLAGSKNNRRKNKISGRQLTLFTQPASGLIGVDEVGRGCLAGPVMAAAVMLPNLDPDSEIAELLFDLNDSKQLTAKKRERLALVIHACALTAIGSASCEEIDAINILQASHLAMCRAVQNLLPRIATPYDSTIILVDGKKPIKDDAGSISECEQIAVPFGDTKSASIAAASVVAKVARDKIMRDYADEFPGYGWLANKGYPSQGHCLAIAELGLTSLHRKTFNWQARLMATVS